MKKILALLGILMFATMANGQNPKKFYKAGKTFVESGKHEDAIQQFTQAIGLKPAEIDYYIARGESYEALERYDEAFEDYEKAQVFAPKDVDVLFLLGKICNKKSEYEKSLKYLNRASKLAKREARIYPEKIYSLLALREYEQVLKVSDTAMLFKENALNYYQRGLAYESLNNDILAKRDFTKAISKDKRYDEARLALANLLVRNNGLNLAMEHCTELLSYNDRSTEAYLVRSKIYISQLDYPSAINDISRNILIESENPDHYFTRASYYQSFNQHPNAINDFSKAISLNETNPDYYFKRASSYESIMNFEKAALDYITISELSEFDMRARKMLAEAEARLYEINRESDPPSVKIVSPGFSETTVEIRGDADKIIISGSIIEKSLLTSLIINGNESLFERSKDGTYGFLSNLDLRDIEEVTILAVDEYNNQTSLSYVINRTEITPPEITIVAPYASDDGQIYLDSNAPRLYIEGKIADNSLIKSIFIEGVTASYAVEQQNPTFTAMVSILNKNKITVEAEDVFGNKQATVFILNREGAAIAESNPMGKTWVVFIENSNYTTFASLDGPVKDINLMKRALTNYQIHNIIHKKDISKAEMEKFFSIELRDLIRSNQVKSLLIWYAGHGKFVNDVGYWIPVDAKRDDEFTYFNINTLRAAMDPYVNILTHTLVVTDACESGPSFYTAMRSTPKARSCDDWQATQFKSSQVFSSAGRELASDDSQFTRTFANTLESNPNSCIPIEDIVLSVTMAVTNDDKQKPKFGKIAGLKDEDGTFFFIAK